MYAGWDKKETSMQFDKDIERRQGARPQVRSRQLSLKDREKRQDRATLVLLCSFSAVGLATSVLMMLGPPRISTTEVAFIAGAAILAVLGLSYVMD
jgi:hypothetical protein